ncbi:MAG TPA: hypothetical protein VK206_22370 [Anaerolineales bacterium]|nr:hypothetical protein [Anaerolineales bacterium]
MQRLYSLLFILIFLSLLTGCASKAAAQREKVKAVENPTSTTLPETSTPIASATPEIVPHDSPASCPVTLPQNPSFTAPTPYSPNAPWSGQFWYGSKSLWIALPTDGTWSALPHNPEGYTQKIPWWREGYSWTAEPEPLLVVTGERLDAKAPPLNASAANGSYAADMGSAMMMGVDFPTLGCWKITGKYKDAELGFVVWVAP